jgi:hypothetical protein
MYYSYVEIENVATSFSPTRTDLGVKLLKGNNLRVFARHWRAPHLLLLSMHFWHSHSLGLFFPSCLCKKDRSWALVELFLYSTWSGELLMWGISRNNKGISIIENWSLLLFVALSFHLLSKAHLPSNPSISSFAFTDYIDTGIGIYCKNVWNLEPL